MLTWLTGFFGNPALLAGASAGAIPIIIHLLNKQRFKRIWWGAMHWLWAAQKRAHKRLRIEQLLLLLLRVLVLILLALALARPALKQALGLLAGQSSTYRVIVLDNSYSMGYLAGGQPLFEKARKLAIELVQDLHLSDQVDVLLINDLPQELTTNNKLKHQEVIQDLQAARCSDGSTHLAKGVAAACRLIAERASLNLRKEIIVLTDQTRAAWETKTGPKKLDAAEEAAITRVFDDPKLKPHIYVVRIPSGGSGENLAAARLEIEEKVVTAGTETQLTASLLNLGTETLQKVPVTLIVDEEKVGHEEVARLEPLKPETVLFRHTFRQTGSHAVAIQLPADVLPQDNTSYLALDVRKEMKVLCVDGMQRTEPMSSELSFFRQALSPTRSEEAQAGKMPLLPEVIGDGRFLESNLDEYPLVILANVRLIPKEKIPSMLQYVKAGGCLWFWLGDRVDPPFYNKELDSLLPATIGLPVGTGDSEGAHEVLSDKFLDHPALLKFRNIKFMNLNALEVYRRFKLAPKTESPHSNTLRTLLALENGDPLAVEWQIGAGRVLLIGTTANKAWCNWPAKSHYMPLVNSIALDLIQPPYLTRNRAVGEVFQYRVPREELGDIRRHGIKLQAPGGEILPMDLQLESFSAICKPTTAAGIYTAEIPGERPRVIHFAANRNLEESELDSIEDQEILAHLPPAKDRPADSGSIFPDVVTREDFVLLQNDFKSIEAELSKDLGGKELWRWLVVGVLLLLVSESILAKRFGDFNR